MKRYIAALDQGTTSSRAILFDGDGCAVASAQYEFPQIYPSPGWVEQDSDVLFDSQLRALTVAMRRAGVSANDLAAIGIANQRETTIVWERATGKPVFHAVVWQCRRTAEACERIKAKHGERVREKTGLNVDAYFSASKIAWILDNVPHARERAERGELAFGTVDSWLIWNLTGGKVHATDYTNASRTMLFNIHTRQWDEELCRIFRVPAAMLPQVLASGASFGMTDKAILGAEVPICAVVGDQQASLFGHRCLEDGQVKNTYGTGCFLLMNTGEKPVSSRHGLLTTLAASFGEPAYALEGSVFVAGAALQWLRDGLRILANSAESEELARSVPDCGGVGFVPAFVGLGAPHWDADCRGVICGITRGTTRAHIVRAALESIALQTADVVRAMECDRGAPITRICADGGASANGFLMQFQADILGVPVERAATTETTALGAAYLAGQYCGFYGDLSRIGVNCASGAAEYFPQMDERTRAEKLREWRSALRRTLYRER